MRKFKFATACDFTLFGATCALAMTIAVFVLALPVLFAAWALSGIWGWLT